tara:strand:- start:1359 stop:3149 length:1791 start_codon:yes stop_codon:yes gene_type:complete
MNTLIKLFNLLSESEKKRTSLIVFLILIMATLDALGVASILPFMAVLANPDLIISNQSINFLYKGSLIFGIESEKSFLFFLGVLVFFLLIVSLAFKALTTYAQSRFLLMREYSIGKRLIGGYLSQPYNWFLNRNSADLGKNILSEISTVIRQGMIPLMNLIAQSAITIAILILLLMVDTFLTLIVFLSLSSAYGLTYIIVNRLLRKLGKERVQSNKERYTAVSEAFGAAKEVKFGNLEKNYINRFSKPAKIFAKGQALSKVITQLPRYAFEAIAFGGMMLVILFLMHQKGSFSASLPLISLYAFAGYRLMPALQQIYGAITQLRFTGPAVDNLYKDIGGLEISLNLPNNNKLSLKKNIVLKNIHYSYSKSSEFSLKDINIEIPIYSKVGIVGTTGSGKTTLVDIILGLLYQTKGKLFVDDEEVHSSRIRDWQNIIGYVSQSIYLSDDTIAANIAFGVDPKKIDYKNVIEASKIANLDNFVSDLNDGYETIIGERGVRLSGGQRQRIGIARALYRNPDVLVFDEATSALDNITEQNVMKAVESLNGNKTILMVAHRLSTVKKCDQIILLDKGTIKAKGSYSKLIEINDEFNKMANLT